jgi:hypothetical protein
LLPHSAAACIPAQLSLADFRALGGPGPALDAYAVYVLVTVLAASLVFIAVGGLIARRKWDNLMGLFTSLVFISYGGPGLLTFGATPTMAFGTTDRIHVPAVLVLSGPVISGLGIAVEEVIYPALAIFLLTFPTGRFAPRWSALLVLIWIAQDLVFFIGAPFAIIGAMLLTAEGSMAAVQVYRYARLYTPVQRQQTKWVVFSFALIALPLVIGYSVAPVFWPTLTSPGSAYRLANIVVLMLGTLPISLGVGVAILRYRLYDIDVIIRRTLVYGTLTAMLVVVYFGVVIGLQALTGTVNRQASHSPVIIVASTLLIAGLFTPLRRGIQAAIDRRFYRRKYDTEKTLAAFGTRLRTETDLAALREHVVSVVQETMQPALVSLWLAPRRRAPNQQMAEPPLRLEARKQES